SHTDRALLVIFVFCSVARTPTFTLFPYTTLFRSARDLAGDHRKAGEGAPLEFVLTIGGRDNPVLDALVFPGQHRAGRRPIIAVVDRKSTRLNSSHVKISYAVFCLKKKNRNGSFCY